MEISDIEKTRKRLFAQLCVTFFLIAILGFTIVDFIEGDTLEEVIDIIAGMILIAGFIGLIKLDADLLIYRLMLVMLSVSYLYNVSIGSGNGTAIYWLFSFPIVFVFFLGKNEGGVACAIFFGMLCVLLINPFSLDIYSYGIGVSLRFLTSLLLVALIAYSLEASREKYIHLLTVEQTNLLDEKQNLERALKEVKTLSGLIPICSNCKKIRDDEGYWQQVETYVRNHSTADFSHGICPECYEKLYPDFPNSDDE